MDLGLSGKKAVIIGGSSGIGRAIAERLVEEGAHISLCGRSEEAIQELQTSLGSATIALARQVDAADAEALDTFLRDAIAALGGIDVLIVNAFHSPTTDDAADWERSFHGGVMVAVRACARVLPKMATERSGSIVFIGSIAATQAGYGTSYSAMKAALLSYSKSVASQCGQYGIRANCVAPGPVLLEGNKWDVLRREHPERFRRELEAIPMGRMAHPNDVADVVAFVASSRARWMSGTCVVVDGGQREAII